MNRCPICHYELELAKDCNTYICTFCGNEYESVSDNVNHPTHYNQGKIEVIDFIEAWNMNFNTGNVVKYISRAKYKGKELEDLKKARFYLDREIKRAENELHRENQESND